MTASLNQEPANQSKKGNLLNKSDVQHKRFTVISLYSILSFSEKRYLKSFFCFFFSEYKN